MTLEPKLEEILMKSRREEAQLIKDYTDAIQFVKLETLRPEHVPVDIAKMKKTYNVRGELLPVMVDMGMLTLEMQGKTNTKKTYSWVYGDKEITTALVKKVQDAIRKKTHKSQLPDATKPQKPGSNVPAAKVNKQPDRVPKKRIHYTGTLFSLDQLRFMGKQIFHKPATIQIDEDITIPNLSQLRFEVKDSILLLRAYRNFVVEGRTEGHHSTEEFQDEEVFTKTFRNCGLAMRYGHEDSKIQTLVIESVGL